MGAVLGLDEISPEELLADVINRLCDPDLAPAGVVIGPATDEQTQAGVIQMVDAGQPVPEFYLPLVTVTVQIRAVGGTLDMADRIARGVYRDLHGRSRTVARMASTDQRYLIHSILIPSGPSMHYDGPETYECLMFPEIRFSTDPL